jgi:hypothetical protein
MNKMIYYIIPLVLLMVVAYSAMANSSIKDPNKYKFLFRNDIFSSIKKDAQADDSIFQLAPVVRGKAYRPSYLYLPEQEHYLVCCRVEPFGFRRYDVYAPPHPQEVVSHVLLNNKGQVLHSFDTFFRFSIRSGMFFTEEFYINWLESGDTTKKPYAGIYNRDIKMNSLQFADKFRELYAQADYMEFVNLRTQYSDTIGQGVVFKIEQEWHILLDAVDDNHIYGGNLKEDARTGVDTYIYKLKFDYNDPDRELKNPYTQSPPLLKSTYLETNDPRPYGFRRWANHDGLKLVKYMKQSSTGWQGVAVLKGIPIFVPGTEDGIAFMKYKTKKGAIYFKVLDVTKYDYRAVYNLGVRTFKLPTHVNVKESLVFMESTQNFGHFLREGGGVYVVRPCAKTECTTSSLPEGMSEERYNQLPLSLQIALMDVDGTSQLKVGTWYPEIARLYNLNYLKITGELKVLPDEVSALNKLQVLDLYGCGIQAISPKIIELKQLKLIDLYRNGLTSLPLEICELNELTHLNIGSNKIHELPSCISNLTNLKKLNLEMLSEIVLPETMVGMKELRIESDDDLKETVPERFHFLFEEEGESDILK